MARGVTARRRILCEVLQPLGYFPIKKGENLRTPSNSVQRNPLRERLDTRYENTKWVEQDFIDTVTTHINYDI